MRAIRSFLGSTIVCAIFPTFAATAVPAPERSNACALLSRFEVQQRIGIPVGEGESRVSIGTVNSCVFDTREGGRIGLLVRRAPSQAWLSQEVARMNRGVRLGTYREVPGIGDRSYLYDMRTAGAVLCVFGAGYYLQVSLLHAGEIPTPAALRNLAALALSRLNLTTTESELQW